MYRILFRVVLFVLLIGVSNKQWQATSQTSPSTLTTGSNYALDQQVWIAQQIAAMTPNQRIAQLIMVAAYSNKDEAHRTEIANLIKQYKIGGLIFMQGTTFKQVELTNYYQSISSTPLLIATDAEWGLSMRLDDAPQYPRQLTLGAIQNNRLIEDMGRDIARQCRRLGVHVNFAPVVDVNVNPSNPVINDRSFGENKYNVAEKGIAYMRGMETNGLIACAKHFPGHGDTDADSHYTLPVINHDRTRLNEVELYPFKRLIENGVGSMMIAHLAVPTLDAQPISATSSMTMPTTLSKKVVTDLLKNEMGYQGLIFTDALNMQGVAKFFGPGEVDAKALLAGNDILLFSGSVSKAIHEINKAIAAGLITQDEIDNRVRKVLAAKFRMGLYQQPLQPINTSGLQQDLWHNAEALNRQLYENAITLARNDKQQVPIIQLANKKIAALAIGANSQTDFQRTLSKYAPIEQHTLKWADTETKFIQKTNALKKSDLVIISLHGLSRHASKGYGISAAGRNLISQLQAAGVEVIVVVFGNPYSLKFFENSPTIAVGYEDTPYAQNAMAQALFGAIGFKGRLPISAGSFKYGQGYNTQGHLRLKYTIPEELGINSFDLLPIDYIVQQAIATKAMPGCQVLIAKNGKVFFERSYGSHTYGASHLVLDDDLYDIASITKIAASALGLMDMYDAQKLNLYGTLGNYLPETVGSNKENLRIRDILIHEAGLEGWIPFYEQTVFEPTRSQVYAALPSEGYNVPVANNLWMRNDYLDTVWETIRNSKLPNRGTYKYSDVGFYYFKKILENFSGKSLDQYLNDRFYKPLGLTTLGYHPLECFSRNSIVPSSNDTEWRYQVIQGYVHDMGAAMLGGVSGHAGLFSNANDLAVIMQMLLNGGYYGGQTYLQQATVNLFTSQQKNGNRRGLVFDKPEPNKNYIQPTSQQCSFKTFGHTGFTGTCVWADPEQQLIYVFLSNRTYPSMHNNKLNRDNVRIKIHDAIYTALARSNPTLAFD
ncbi:MAG: serine hydrolase [Chitinophagales bacterium]|jgi:beta-N-acetylhexosaminidase|nr:serine hydrolase [Sphingobacteriales bacterium]MBP9140374.1 serine hydrolase [Chitinophagales bacterium]MDA0199794.1 serine hydrolase [Bacteroidota bacterium]MBK6890062.1 serine hydrolase [Sphingobacteriales bacterium]MBK8678239.1 serine hydrolase [Sphingobacteriales bacterium]